MSVGERDFSKIRIIGSDNVALERGVRSVFAIRWDDGSGLALAGLRISLGF